MNKVEQPTDVLFDDQIFKDFFDDAIDDGVDRLVEVATPLLKNAVDQAIPQGTTFTANFIKNKVAPHVSPTIKPVVDAAVDVATKKSEQTCKEKVGPCLDGSMQEAAPIVKDSFKMSTSGLIKITLYMANNFYALFSGK